MTYKLFIDDERFPVVIEDWKIARTIRDVQAIIDEFGVPSFISFDHDLGANEPSGMDITKMLVEMDMDGKIDLDQNFAFYVHSQNGPGTANINSYLSNYLKVKRNEHRNGN